MFSERKFYSSFWRESINFKIATDSKNIFWNEKFVISANPPDFKNLEDFSYFFIIMINVKMEEDNILICKWFGYA